MFSILSYLSYSFFKSSYDLFRMTPITFDLSASLCALYLFFSCSPIIFVCLKWVSTAFSISLTWKLCIIGSSSPTYGGTFLNGPINLPSIIAHFHNNLMYIFLFLSSGSLLRHLTTLSSQSLWVHCLTRSSYGLAPGPLILRDLVK